MANKYFTKMRITRSQLEDYKTRMAECYLQQLQMETPRRERETIYMLLLSLEDLDSIFDVEEDENQCLRLN